MLLLHGFTGSSANWHSVIKPFGANFRLAVLDILGHGKSAAPADPERYRMERVAADVIALLDELRIEQTDLLGYSMGGRLALYLALTYPDRFGRLILESSSPGLATEAERAARRQSDENLAAMIEHDGIEAFVGFWERLALWASQETLEDSIQERQRRQRLANRPVGLANSLRGMGTGSQPSLWNRLGQLDRPVLLINGTQDSKYVAINQQMLSFLPQAAMYTQVGVGHNVHLEAPEYYLAAILEWLEQQPPTI